ncbi:MAG: T9SS type A sorting domain-containing protein [Crocinitomicaceae bacterium]|nr:T9SS type A sorting domain-containing protein [Crocinitomicaceae bacterium]
MILCFALFPMNVLANNFIWTGAVSSDWNDPLNWSPNGVPNSSLHNVTINTNSPNICNLDVNRTINNLLINAASFQLLGNQLTISNDLIVQNSSVVSEGSILANRIQLSNSNVINIHLTKTGNVNNDDNINGNLFSNFQFVNNSARRAWFGNAMANNFLGNTIFQINSSGAVEVSRTALGNSFDGSLNVIINGDGNFRMGGNGGTTILSASCKFILNSSANSNILIQNLQQAASGDSILLNTNHNTDIFQNIITGKLILNNSGNTVRLENNILANKVSLFCNRIQLRANNVFGLGASDSLYIQKNGWGHDDWFGGNTFNGVTTIVNNTSSAATQGRIILSRFGSSGDLYNSDLHLKNLNGHDLWLSHSNASVINGDLHLTNLDVNGGVLIGRLNQGFLQMSAGNALKNDGFSRGQLRIDEFIQHGNVANDLFNPNQGTIQNSIFGGDFAVTAANNIEVINTEFKQSTSLEGSRVLITQGNVFNVAGGTTAITKNGWGNDDWDGGNVFHGNTTITNNSSAGNRRIHLARNGSIGDVFHANLSLVNTGTGEIVLGYNFNTVVHGNISLSNAEANGRIDIGRLNNGVVEIASGGALINGGFSAGELRIFELTQNGSSTNDLFNPNQGTIQNSIFGGDFAVTAANNIEVINTEFKQSTSLEGSRVLITQGNVFNVAGGTTAITKNGWGNDDWDGGNVFHGNTTITNNSSAGNRRIHLARNGSIGDVFHANLSLVNTGTGEIVLGYNFNTVVHGNISLSNAEANGRIDIGRLNNGVVEIASGGALINGGFSGGELRIFEFIQHGSLANNSFYPDQCILQNAIFGGDFAVTAANIIEVNNTEFKQSISLEGSSVLITQGNVFNEDGGTTTIIKNGWGNDFWDGGNVFFGNAMIVNNSLASQGQIYTSRFGTLGDVFHLNVHLINNTEHLMILGHSNQTDVFGNILLENALPSGAIRVGRVLGGNVIQHNSGLLINQGFSNGELQIINFTQEGNGVNDDFSPDELRIINSSFNGDFHSSNVNTLEINQSLFKGNNVFTANNISLLNGNVFGDSLTTTAITKTGAFNNDWQGSNTFFNTTITNASFDRRIWMANNNKGDVFYGNTQFIRSTTAELVVARNDTSFFYGGISTIGSSQPVQFATNNGTMVFTGDDNKVFVAPPNQDVDFRRVVMLTQDTLFLNSPVRISVNLNLVQGIISNNPSAMLTLGNENVSNNLGSLQSHVDGVMQINMSNNSTSRRSLYFPLAKGGEFRPVLLEVAHSNNTSYTYRGEVILGNANDLGYTLPLGITHVSLVRHWKIERFQTDNMSPQPTSNLRMQPSNRPQITLNYGASDGVTDPNNLVICKSDITGHNWLNIGGFGSAPTVGFITSNSIPDLFDSFSDFTLGNMENGINPLPVELLFLRAENFGNFNKVTWGTATELNNDFFTLERSRDGFNFHKLAIIQGSGNSNSPNDYEVIDEQPFSGINYYRLKQTDFDGTTEYFPIVSCLVAQKNTRIYPNPSNGKLFIETDLRDLVVIGANGNIVAQFTLYESQINQIDLSQLSPGIYFLSLTGDERTESHKVVIH